MRCVRVLIVDDSPTIRRVLKSSLEQMSWIEVVGLASDPYQARDQIFDTQPDVMLLDIQMPKMNGLDFLEKIMQYRAMPVFILSSLTIEKSEESIIALERGAVEVFPKPNSGISLEEVIYEIIDKLRVYFPPPLKSIRYSQPSYLSQEGNRQPHSTHLSQITPSSFDLLVIGASTGGVNAISNLLAGFPLIFPPTLIVQHIPAQFSAAFAKRLNEKLPFEIREAKQAELLKPSTVYIAPGGQHMSLMGNRIKLDTTEKVHHQRPAVDILFQSVVKLITRAQSSIRVKAVLLTGMGVDGAQGLLSLNELGVETIAQNEDTCVVYGMPKAAVELGAAQHVLPLHQIPKHLFPLN